MDVAGLQHARNVNITTASQKNFIRMISRMFLGVFKKKEKLSNAQNTAKYLDVRNSQTIQ